MGEAFQVDYNPALGLYATCNDNGAAVWDSKSREVIARFKDVGENLCGVLFLPGDCLAVSSTGYYVGGMIDIYTLDKKKSKPAKFTLEGKRDLPISSPRALALSPNKTLLVANQDIKSWSAAVYELVMDWNDLKVIKSEEIDLINENIEIEEEILGVCCSPDFKIAT